MNDNYLGHEVVQTAELTNLTPALVNGLVKENQNRESRETLVTEYLPLVNSVMHRLSPRLASSVEADDIRSAGVIGLVDAAQRYDSNREIQFRTYAEFRVRGAMLDYLRSLTWAPRGMYGRLRELESVRSEVENRIGRNATMSELAEEMGLSAEQQHALMLNINRVRFCDDGAFYEEKSLLQASMMSADQDHHVLSRIERKETLALLTRAIDGLPERQKLVLWLYYFEELTMKEVGAVLKVNEARISQIHSKAIATLRREMKRLLGGESRQDESSERRKSSRRAATR
ncbi:MAG TPA: FliA/WhiG family RNA polymerase sigma factor [Blastocatellia bacterium]|jgi:RNA polymerase sigma factor for flagellar operon FliA|nr:FliA/WhiG family RNA polymerase sigma factor [Blastocatellia bacterium]